MTSSTKRPVRILLIDDSEEDAFFLLRTLERASYSLTHERVQTKSRLQHALGKAPWDLVLCDNSMPVLTGREAWELVRKDYPKLPFLFLSGADRPPASLEKLSATFLQKGNTAALLAAIEGVLEGEKFSPAAPLPPESRAENPETFSADLMVGAPRILIVDDRGENLDTLEAVLGPLGFPLVRASSGEETLERLLKEEYALILLDVRMPGLSGIETAKLLRKRAKSRSVPIIFMTAGPGEPGDVAQGYDAGCVDYLTKPFVPEVLKAKVSVFLELWRKNAILELQKAELKSANESLDAFTSSASHDLRAPLRSIATFGEILCQDYAGKLLDQAGVEYADHIRQAARRMNALTEDLLVFARLARTEVSLGPVDLAEVVDQLLQGLKDEIHLGKGVVSVDRPLGTVRGHAVLLRQALTNLITNGLKFAAPGQSPEITIRTEHRGDMVRILVEDRGIGISRSEQEKLFRPFVRLEAAEPYPGTGLGLAIVKKAVERMQGHVGVESRAGRGSTFFIDLPRTC